MGTYQISQLLVPLGQDRGGKELVMYRAVLKASPGEDKRNHITKVELDFHAESMDDAENLITTFTAFTFPWMLVDSVYELAG